MRQPRDCQACLEIIRKISSELTSTLKFDEVLRHIVKMTAEAMRVKGCALRLINESTRELSLAAAWGLSEDYLSKGPLHADQSLSACMKGEIVHIPDVMNDPRIEYPEDAKGEGIVTMLSIPMVSRNKVVGVLRLYTAEERRFPESEIDFVRTLADLGTLAIEHARLYSRLREDHDSLIENFHNWFETSTYNPAGSSSA
ncbi:MAG: GAF domain-containing protein [bacterium]